MSAPSLFWPGDHRAGDVFSHEAYARALVAVEVAWLRVLAASGAAPAGTADALAAVALDPDQLIEIATDAEGGGNPVIPLLVVLRSRLPDADARWLHKGLTSQDVVDTALMMCARSALDHLADDLGRCVAALVGLAEQHRQTIMVGRTLTQHAVPITFGLKAAGWLAGVLDALDGVAVARKRLRVQCGGAAGTRAAIAELAGDDGADWSAGLAAQLSLAASPPWHTRRTPVTAIGDALVTTTDALGHMASDIVVLSRPEIAEVSEPAREGRGGSSAMPQKRNPVLAVLIRRAAATAPLLGSQLHLASAQAVDERPVGAWHTEWQPLALLARHAVTAASQAAELVEGLEVHADAMAATVQRAMPRLLAERVSILALTGRPAEAADPSDYLGATQSIIDATLERAERTGTQR
jgi:3-carboxy-cis,cis-muconate cycloisomerase